MAEGQRAYAVGIPSIDALHVELEERLAALIHAGDDAQDKLAALQDHLQRHFAHEESLMSGTEFPMADCHAREHASVIEVVGEVKRLLDGGDRGPLARLAPAMLEWFAVHAAGMDAALANYLKRTASPAT
ncbi:MAG: bacteriohemerythrin [Burkholderiaceae bacterium]